VPVAPVVMLVGRLVHVPRPTEAVTLTGSLYCVLADATQTNGVALLMVSVKGDAVLAPLKVLL
jgi:hypothetical protein